jgi:hypothetical protein
LRALGALAVAAAIAAPAAGGATPRDIYRDLVDNGRLDGRYTQAELAAYARDASVQGYGNPSVVVVPKPRYTCANPGPGTSAPGGVTWEEYCNSGGVAGASNNLAATPRAQGTLPFTGAELTIFALVGALLVASGLLLRASARQKS